MKVCGSARQAQLAPAQDCVKQSNYPVRELPLSSSPGLASGLPHPAHSPTQKKHHYGLNMFERVCVCAEKGPRTHTPMGSDGRHAESDCLVFGLGLIVSASSPCHGASMGGILSPLPTSPGWPKFDAAGPAMRSAAN